MKKKKNLFEGIEEKEREISQRNDLKKDECYCGFCLKKIKIGDFSEHLAKHSKIEIKEALEERQKEDLLMIIEMEERQLEEEHLGVV